MEKSHFLFDINKKILKRFAKRLYRHKKELFTFLYEKDIDYHNNHAEQQIRPDVIFRKITFGNRSYRGAENHIAMALAPPIKEARTSTHNYSNAGKLSGVD